MHVCTCVWRPEVDVWCLPQPLSTLYIEVEALMNLELASLLQGFAVCLWQARVMGVGGWRGGGGRKHDHPA